MSTQTEESLFKTDDVPASQPEVENPDTSESAFADQLAEIRNERGEPKYKDLPTALEALKASQEYIPQLKGRTQELEAQIAALQEQISKQAAVEDFVDRLKQSSVDNQPSAEPQAQPQGGLTQDQLQQLLDQYVPELLQKREQETVATQNIRAVESALRGAFGEKASDALSAKSQELGLSVQRLQELSKESPQLVLSFFNLKPQSKGGPTVSSTNIPPVAPSQEQALKRPERSLLLGAKSGDLKEFMAQVREEVYRKNGITR